MKRPMLATLAWAAFAAPLSAQEPPLQSGDSILPFRGGTVLWAFNPGTDTIWVDTLFLRACRNVRNDCGALPLSLAIPPRSGRRLLRITPEVPREAIGYRWTFTWRVVTKVEPEEEPDDTTDPGDDDRP